MIAELAKIVEDSAGQQQQHKEKYNVYMHLPRLRQQRHLAPDGGKICFELQKNLCRDRACPFVHKCAACLGTSLGFDKCSCVKPQ